MVTVADWVLVLVLAVLIPVWSWFDYQAYKKRVEATAEDLLSNEYRKTIVLHALMAVPVLALWWALSREWGILGFSSPKLLSNYGSGVILSILILLGPAINLIGVLSGTDGDKVRMEAYGPTRHFLPRTRGQHRWAMAVSMSAGIGEEIAYRGFVMWLLAFFMPIYAVITVQALIFGLLHSYQGVSGILSTGLVGAVLGLVYFLTGSLWLPIVLHIAIDALSLTAAFVVLSREATSEETGSGA